jgi:hypothetical protein
MRLYVCIWLASFTTQFMPKDLDMAGGDGLWLHFQSCHEC